MKMARIRISDDLFRDAFRLPFGTRIISACVTDYVSYGPIVEITVAHDDLPNLEEGQDSPLITPTFRRNYWPIEFVDWGIKK